jgi:class 3 adenylate cyclase/putative methionine-R-sulfoxide reductase with GAF domain
MSEVDQSPLSFDDLLTLVRLGNELASRLDDPNLLRRILEDAALLTDSPDGSVILYDEQRSALYFAEAIGEKREMLLETFGKLSKKTIPVASSIAGRVLASGKAEIQNAVSNDEGHFKGVDERTQHDTVAMITIPLLAGTEALGVMQMLNTRKGNYCHRDQLILEYFATQAAIAIKNAKGLTALLAHMGLYASMRDTISFHDFLKQLSMPPSSQKLTIMFADMRGFRSFCQIVEEPSEVFDILNQFTSFLAQHVLDHGGIVNKFLGDGLLAIFKDQDHAKRAVACAFSITDGFERLRATWYDTVEVDISFLDVGIGISTGKVVFGSVGSVHVKDFTAIGTPVNLAASLEDRARDGKRILVDHNTYLAVRDIVEDTKGPFSFELRQADQKFGAPYKYYHLDHQIGKGKLKVFVSHSHRDRAYVEETLMPLLKQIGYGTWYSRADIKGGESWLTSITQGLKESDSMIVIVSENATKENSWIPNEIAMAGAMPHLRNRIIPISVDDTEPRRVHDYLNHIQALDGRSLADLGAILKRALNREVKPGEAGK